MLHEFLRRGESSETRQPRLQGWLVLTAVAGLLAACGGGYSDDESAALADPAVATPAYASWMGSDEPMETFDVTEQKTNPEIIGVDVVFEYETGDPPGLLQPDLRGTISIDGQRLLGTSYEGGTLAVAPSIAAASRPRAVSNRRSRARWRRASTMGHRQRRAGRG